MQRVKKQRVIIGTLVAVIVGMCVGYAALSQILTINGTSGITGDFNIQFTKIEESTMVNSKTITKGGIGTVTANFTVDLEKPGSSALYDLTVENKGTIDAVLTSIEGLDESNNKAPTDIVYSVTSLAEGESLNAGASKNFQVKVVWNASATSIPETTKTLTLKLNYEQKTGSGNAPAPDIASAYLVNNYLKGKVLAGGNGLVALDNTGEITTSSNPREYRYIGSNPDNYVQFNNELWRIIGIFDGQLKIMKKDSLGDIPWDKGSDDGGTHDKYGWNDWSQATLQTYLNGEYLNSMDSVSQGMISTYTWKLGGSKSFDDVTAQMFYERERGTEVYTGRPTEWTGKIALMYPSDYGFSTSGGSTTNRNSCLAKELYNWGSSTVSDCRNNSWLYARLKDQWTLTPEGSNWSAVFYVHGVGDVRNGVASWSHGVRPSLNLESRVEIISGSGQESDPFILQ